MESVDRRVRRPSQWGELLEALTPAVFETNADALTFAASVGYAKGRRRAFDKVNESIRMSIFENRGHTAIPDLLALAETGEASILADKNFSERIRVFEEYANGGLEIIASRVEEHIKPLDAILSLVNEVPVPVGGEDLSSQLRRLVEH